jgi:hypothetical protein
MIPETTGPNIIRQRTIIVRGGTRTRDAIKIIITQEARGEDGEILNPTIELSGKFDHIFESGRFAEDLGVSLIVAAHYFKKWSEYVTGKR